MRKADDEIIRWTASELARSQVESGRSMCRMSIVALPIALTILVALDHFAPALIPHPMFVTAVEGTTGFCAILFIVGLFEIRRNAGKVVPRTYIISSRWLKVLDAPRSQPLFLSWKWVIGWQVKSDGMSSSPTEVSLIFRNRPPKRIPLPSDKTAAVILQEIGRYAPERPDIDLDAEERSWKLGGGTSLFVLIFLNVLYGLALLPFRKVIGDPFSPWFIGPCLLAGPATLWMLYARLIEHRKWRLLIPVAFFINLGVFFFLFSMLDVFLFAAELSKK